ncbi:MAG: GNAT family N-acetyltransferase [Oscillospiraceae bacterium]|nr:GNAT family N-acetyltransferase [Oscillospiraceae bacterium]
MYQVIKLSKWNIVGLKKVSDILYECGKDMAKKYDLHHWDNSHLKNHIIVTLCAMKNNIYLVYNEKTPVATFQTRKIGQSFLFQKLATIPMFSGSGIGSCCLTEIERLAIEAGCTEVVCEVYDKSEHAKSFYEHRGYTAYEAMKTLKYNELKLRKKL